MNQTMYKVFRILAMMIVAISAHAESSSFVQKNNLKSECVGIYQINLPSEVTIALLNLVSTGSTSTAKFYDGQESHFSQLHFAGNMGVISPATDTEFIQYKNVVINNTKRTKQKYLHSQDDKLQKLGQGMLDMTYNSPTLFGWGDSDNSPALYFFIDYKVFLFRFSKNDGDDISLNKKYFDSVLNGFRLRSLYETPKQQGICIPYGFIPDDGTTPRNIAVTMRLIDHPDVEIGFQDSTYYEPTIENGKPSSGYLDPKDAINSFFNNSGVTNNLEKVEPNFPGYHSIQMDGHKGGAVFFTIIREDKSKDYGYIAAVKGDDKAGIPSQLLYVIGTASRAKGKPVNKVELKDMAEKIMASVKKHPVQ